MPVAFDVTTVVVAGMGLVGTGGGAWLSYRLGKETAEADTERLRMKHREDERRNRQGTYHRFLAVLDRFDAFARGAVSGDGALDEINAEYNYLHGGILLFAPASVRDATGGVVAVFEGIGEDARTSPGSTYSDRFRVAYLAHRTDLIESSGALAKTMHDDITADILTAES